MVEQFFIQEDLNRSSQVSVHNFLSFGRDKERWFNTLDLLGSLYDGPEVASLLQYVTQNADKHLLVLVTVSDAENCQKPALLSWLVAEYMGDLAVKQLYVSSNCKVLSSAFVQLTMKPRISDLPMISVAGIPKSLDFRA